MDKWLLKKAAMQSVALMIAVITSSYALQQYQTVKISASNIIEAEKPEEEITPVIELSDQGATLSKEASVMSGGPVRMASSLEDLKNQVDRSIMEQLSENYLVIKKPEADNLSISLEDLYINQSVKVNLTGSFQEEEDSSIVMRVRGKDYYLNDPVFTEIVTQVTDEEDGSVKEIVTKDYGKDLSHGITFNTSWDESTGLNHCDITIELDSVYAYVIHEDANYYFIDLKKPTDVYDKILVIDPGHGGKDAGALSRDEKYYEKNINLGIVLALKELLEKEKVKVYYTRTADDKVFLRPRVTLANAVDCDYFISIHCNSNAISSPNGTEVLYYDTKYNGVASKDLAELFSDELGKTVNLKKRGTVLKHMEDIFIMDKAQVPMILIEIGYLSNPGDLKFLTKAENQMTVAQGIYNGIMRAFDELPVSREN